MSDYKSPFLVFQDFLSPKACDEIVRRTELKPFNTDKDGKPIKYECYNEECEALVFQKLKLIVSDIEEHFGINYAGTERILFQHFPETESKSAEEPGCQNSKYLRKKWIKIKDVDLTGIIWFKDYQDAPPFDIKNEVFGGKLELPQYNFSLVPQKGTLILFPAGPHFISAISPILVGSLSQARFNIAVKQPYLYDPTMFKGNYVEWFKEFE